MSALGMVSAGGAWRVATIVLLAILLAAGGSAGTGWWLAAHDRDQALVDLKAELRTSAALRASIDEQNHAIDGMAAATLAAQEGGAAAQAQAAAKGKKYEAALAQIAGARATTCDEAMPAVNLLLEGLR